MGDADQFIKRIFRDETGRATEQAVHFENAPEIATAFLTPDGLLVVADEHTSLSTLPPPWSDLHHLAVTDFKMERDHVGPAALARAEFRRMACWVRHLEEDPAPQPLRPERFATLLVAPYLPEWLRGASPSPAPGAYRVGPLTLSRVGVGCYRIDPRDHPVLWVAANELPLHPALVPFLWARSGRALVLFIRWLAGLRGVQPVATVLRSHPMRDQIAEHIAQDPAQDNDEEYQKSLRMVQILLRGFPEAANDLCQQAAEKATEKAIEKGVEKGVEKALGPLEHLFARRLGRALSPGEHATLIRRLDTHGPGRLGDVVLDLDPGALERWLTDPAAR